jgi:hypothetical protein
MKFNNKILGLVFIGLLAMFLVSKILNKPKVKSFKDVLVNIDTSAVDKIVFYPKGTAEKITILRNGSFWEADNGSLKTTATSSSVNALLSPTTNIKALQLISKNESKWAEYEVDDISGKKIELYNGNKLLSGFYVGRFNFNQNTRSAKSYMRLADENDIYVVDGFLSMSYEKQFNDFRNKRLVNNLSIDEISTLKLISADKRITIEKDLDNHWIDENNNMLDSLKATRAVQGLVNLMGNDIIDYKPNASNKLAQLTLISRENSEQIIDIYKKDEKEFVLASSSNKDVYFGSDSTGIFKTAYLDILNL